MKKIASLLFLSMTFVCSCSQESVSKLADNNTSQILSKVSSKKLNVTERKKTIQVAKNTPKETVFIKDLPKNFLFVPLTRQGTDYTCGVGALQSVMMYYGDEYREDELASALKSDPNEGTPYNNIASFSKSNGYKVTILKDMTLDDLKKKIDAKKPVIVLLQAWSEKPTDYIGDWEDGHYSVAIGYDDKKIYFMDPSTLGYYTYVPVQQFLNRWHDTDLTEKLNHFGMIVEKAKPTYNNNKVLMME